MTIITKIKGTLEIDHARGVIYFHPDTKRDVMELGPTILRVCQISKPIPKPKRDGCFHLDVAAGRYQTVTT